MFGMELWCKISIILCIFGFLKEIRPSEPFIFEYLTGPWRNVTADQITREVYPVATYSYLVLLAVVFLITDLLRYKPLLTALGLSGILFSSMLIWSTSLLALQTLEVVYSVFMATEVAYYAYIYANVDKKYYGIVSSYTRASILCGRAFSGILGQYLISAKITDFKGLHYFTFTAMILATFWSLLLPKVKQSIYFNTDENELINDAGSHSHKLTKAFYLMKCHFMDSYKEYVVLQWSFWYAIGTCCFLQVQSYMQPLWKEIVLDSQTEVYNGAVEAILTLLGVIGAILAGYIKLNWNVWGYFMLIVGCAIQGGVLLITSYTKDIYISYSCYILFGFIYHFIITVASAEIAKKIKEDSFGLIFGFNMLIGMVFQTILTFIIVTDIFSLNLNIRHQYVVYSMVTFTISGTIAILKLFTTISKRF